MLKKIFSYIAKKIYKTINKDISGIVASNSKQSDTIKLLIKFEREPNLPTNLNIKSSDIINNNWLKSLLIKNTDWSIKSVFDDESKKILSSSEINFNYYEITIPKNDTNYALSTFNKSDLVIDVDLIEYKIMGFEVEESSNKTKSGPLYSYQDYLKPAPIGIGIESAWKLPGGKGENIKFADFEYSFLLDHEDYYNKNISFVSGANNGNYSYVSHGTAVLGVIGMQDNNVGGIGITPNFNQAFVGNNDPNHVVRSFDRLSKGDVILLEMQASLNGSYVPIEIHNVWFDVIKEATARGFVVIEPAGNGSVNLDYVTDSYGRYYLNRNSSNFRDSGAIMVGSSQYTSSGHRQTGHTSYGSRIDTYNYGSGVATTSAYEYNINIKNSYTYSFSGTSSASAITTGVVISIQGIHKSSTGNTYSCEQIRSILQNSKNGTPVSHNNITVGYVPNMKNIIGEEEIPQDIKPENIHNFIFNISSSLSNNKVMDIKKTMNTLIINDKTNSKSQNFKFIYDKTKQAYQIMSTEQNNYVLSIGSTYSVFMSYNTLSDSQFWILELSNDGYIFIKSKFDSELVLDLSYSSLDNESDITGYYIHGGLNQKWLLEKIK